MGWKDTWIPGAGGFIYLEGRYAGEGEK